MSGSLGEEPKHQLREFCDCTFRPASKLPLYLLSCFNINLSMTVAQNIRLAMNFVLLSACATLNLP